MIVDRVRCAADASSTPRYGKGRFSAQSVYFRCRFSHGPVFVQTDASDVQSYSLASAFASKPPTTHKQHHHQHPSTAGSYSVVWTHEHSAHTRSTLEDGMRMPKWQGNGFSREGKDHTARKPTRIRSGWSGQGLAKHIWSGSKLVCRNQRDRFPTFRLGSVLPQTSRIILSKTSPDPI